MICFYLSLTRWQLLHITTLWIHHVALGGCNGFAKFSLTMGSLGSFASSSCSVESAQPGTPPHLASPPPCIVCSPAPRHQSGIRALWTSARPSADVKRQIGACWTRLLWSQQTVQFTKSWFSGTVSVCLLAIDSPFSAVSYLSARFKKNNLYGLFFTRAGLCILWHVMMCFWDSTVWKCIKIWSAAHQTNII